MFNLEDVLRTMLDGVCDCVTVSRAKDQRLKNQQIQSSLEHLTLKRGLAPGHVLQYTPVGDRPDKHNCYTLQRRFC